MRAPFLFPLAVALGGLACRQPPEPGPQATPQAAAKQLPPAPAASGADEPFVESETEVEPPPPPNGPRAGPRRTCEAHPACVPFAACPEIGCEPPGTAHALFNATKRRLRDETGAAITWQRARPISLDEVASLQRAAEARLGPQHQELADRAPLRNLESGFGEGTAVRLVGYIAKHAGANASGAHAGGAESVNCCHKDDASHATVDFHIPVRGRRGQTECEGIVVEMVPQGREQHPGWSLPKLRALAERRVMFVGPLFYDNEHQPNPRCGALLPGQPKRTSVWEIHPVVELYVCADDACDATSLAGWTRID